jgi:hypothetical protein
MQPAALLAAAPPSPSSSYQHRPHGVEGGALAGQGSHGAVGGEAPVAWPDGDAADECRHAAAEVDDAAAGKVNDTVAAWRQGSRREGGGGGEGGGSRRRKRAEEEGEERVEEGRRKKEEG